MTEFFETLLSLNAPTVLIVIGALMLLTLVFEEVFGNKVRTETQKLAVFLGIIFVGTGIALTIWNIPSDISNSQPQPWQATVVSYQTQIAKLEALVTEMSATLEITPTPIALAATSAVSVSVAPVASSAETLFFEDFESNTDKWDFSGSRRLSQGKLNITVSPNEVVWIPIKDLKVAGDFYTQAELTFLEGHRCFASMGFVLGDYNINGHRFLLTGNCSSDRIGFFDNDTEIFSTEYGGLLGQNQRHVVGLEAKDGMFTLYVDGKATESSNIQRYGDDIGIVVWRVGASYYPQQASFSIDNIIVKKSR